MFCSQCYLHFCCWDLWVKATALHSLKVTAACVDKQYTHRWGSCLCWFCFLDLQGKHWNELRLSDGQFHISGLFPVEHQETFWKIPIHTEEERRKWPLCHPFPFFFAADLKKKTKLLCLVTLAFPRLLYKSLHRTTHSCETQRRPCVTSHCATVSQLRFWGRQSANSQQQCRAFPPLANHSQKCHPSPENVFLHCSMTWHVPKVSVLYKYLWREK